MEKKSSLYDEMKKFHSEKKNYIIALIILGVLGLMLPIIPGLLLIGLGIALISPKYGEALLEKIKKWFNSLVANLRFR
jgi:uncharacterized protein YqgC (DUF456 family)